MTIHDSSDRPMNLEPELLSVPNVSGAATTTTPHHQRSYAPTENTSSIMVEIEHLSKKYPKSTKKKKGSKLAASKQSARSKEEVKPTPSLARHDLQAHPEPGLSLSRPGVTENPAGSEVTSEDAYFVVANDDISLSIKTGEIFGLLGPNGAGKTTLVNQILGLTTPTAGSIRVSGIDALSQPHLIKSITAYLPQRGMAFDNIEVWRTLLYTGQLRGLSKQEAQSQSQDLIKRLDLAEVVNLYTGRLSGGMKRIVGLATALMGHPRLLVLDEPTNELDPVRRRQVWDSIREISRQRGITCLLVTHNLLEAESVIDRLAIISKGRVILKGSLGEIKQQFTRQARLELVLKEEFIAAHSDLLQYFSNLLRQIGYISDSVVEDSFCATPDFPFQPKVEFGTGSPYWSSHNSLVPYRVELRSNGQPSLFMLPQQADEMLKFVLRSVGLGAIEDFKLSLVSLEDVYLHLLTQDEAERN